MNEKKSMESKEEVIEQLLEEAIGMNVINRSQWLKVVVKEGFPEYK